MARGLFKPVENIETGDGVLATGANLNTWSIRQVTGVGGIAPGETLAMCYTARFKLSDGTVRLVTSTADHLYLVPGLNQLQAIQDLRPGDYVLQADGGSALIEFVAAGEFSGGVRNFALGEFAPTNPDDQLDGHLVNTDGLVTADLSLQLAFWNGDLEKNLIAQPELPAPLIGSRQFFERYDTELYQSFVNDPKQWPAHFTPVSSPLLNIPPSASLFFSSEESNLLLEVVGGGGLGDSLAAANFKSLKKLLAGSRETVVTISDWGQALPAAWQFRELGQNFLVFSGGLLRLPSLSVAGLSIIASHLLARSTGIRSVVEADYWGIAKHFREVHLDDSFFQIFERGLKELTETISPLKEASDPDWSLRLKAVTNGASFLGVPESSGEVN